MNATPSRPSQPARPSREEVFRWMSDLFAGELDAAEAARLEQFVIADAVVRRWYIEFTCDVCNLRTQVERESKMERLGDKETWSASDPTLPQKQEFESPHLPISPSPSLNLPSVSHEPIATVFSRSSWREYVVPCLASAAIMAVLGVWAWVTKVSTGPSATRMEQQIANANKLESALPQNADLPTTVGRKSNGKKAVVVGRITNAVDCRWQLVGSEASGERKLPIHESNAFAKSQQGANAFRSPSVSLGDTLRLSGGELEITYDTGAKVTLEGPCTFHVETNGGFLTIGRLTGVMEKKVGRGQWAVDSKVGVRVGSGSETKLQIPKSQNPEIPGSSNPQSLIPNPSLATSHQPLATSFTIATPTAVITDLGTEFGVAVNRDRATTIQVIRGEVEATREAVGGATPIRQRLTAGQAIYIASLNDLPIRLDGSEYFRPLQSHERRAGTGPRLVLSPELKKSLKQVHQARDAQTIAKPIALVASAYHHVLDKNGRLLAENSRRLAFGVVTDDIFGRGVGGEDPRSSFDTERVDCTRDERRGARGEGIEYRLAPASTPGSQTRRLGEEETRSATGQTLSPMHKSESPRLHVSSSPRQASPRLPISKSPQSAFVGLRYAKPTRFDRIKIFFGPQTAEGGCWAETPRIFILKHPVDTDATPPESDSANWRELPYHPLYGAFSPTAKPGPGLVWEIALTGSPEKDRIGYGWAIGGVRGNGTRGFITITELRAYTTENEE